MAGILRITLAGIWLVLFSQPQSGVNLEESFRVSAGDEPISVEGGRAAPFFADFNGDGLSDLIVGQVTEGKLRVYINTSTRTEPEFTSFFYLQAGGSTATVPIG